MKKQRTLWRKASSLLAVPFIVTSMSVGAASASTSVQAYDKLPKPTHPKRVQKRKDGTCWETIDRKCPEGVPCNPPAPRRVQCPKPAKDKKSK